VNAKPQQLPPKDFTIHVGTAALGCPAEQSSALIVVPEMLQVDRFKKNFRKFLCQDKNLESC
jgi:hypothetical protein